MSKAEEVVAIAKGEIGAPYVFGARGGLCTPQNRKDRVRSDHPTIVSKCQVLSKKKKNCDKCKYQGRRMYDCRGFTYWVLKQVGITISGAGATSQYNTKSNWAAQGPVSEMPKDKICCVFKYYGGCMQHTGFYIGNGQVIDCSGEVGVRKLTSAWNYYAIPKGLYEEGESITDVNTPTVEPVLKRGSAGADVTALQTLLTNLGYDLGVVDGIFGRKTTLAVKKFQKDKGLKADGVVGPLTWDALKAAKLPETPATKYKVTIGGLSKEEAAALAAKYPAAIVVAVK